MSYSAFRVHPDIERTAATRPSSKTKPSACAFALSVARAVCSAMKRLGR